MSAVTIQEAESTFINDEAAKTKERRDSIIIRTSIIGIITNFLLAAFKAAVGTISGSIAITMDAVNNLSDSASALITIVGTKLAQKPADKEHPFGHGRAEYLSAMIISVIILYAGVTSLVESIKKIINPTVPDYSILSLIIVAVAVIVKIVLGHFVKGVGKRVKSDALVNSGQDATMDSIISASTLVAALIFLFTKISLESWLGAVISLIIIKSGIDMLHDTISRILGEGADLELAKKIKNIVASYPNVKGPYDLILNNYGPENYIGSLHIEVPDTINARQIDDLTRDITSKVLKETGVYLTAIAVYSLNTKDPVITDMHDQIQKIVLSNKNVMQMHGFYVNLEKKAIRFDMVISFDEKDRNGLYERISQQVKDIYPDFQISIIMDTDFSEE